MGRKPQATELLLIEWWLHSTWSLYLWQGQPACVRSECGPCGLTEVKWGCWTLSYFIRSQRLPEPQFYHLSNRDKTTRLKGLVVKLIIKCTNELSAVAGTYRNSIKRRHYPIPMAELTVGLPPTPPSPHTQRHTHLYPAVFWSHSLIIRTFCLLSFPSHSFQICRWQPLLS